MRVLYVSLVSILFCVLFGCGGSGSSHSSTNAGSTSTATAGTAGGLTADLIRYTGLPAGASGSTVVNNFSMKPDGTGGLVVFQDEKPYYGQETNPQNSKQVAFFYDSGTGALQLYVNNSGARSITGATLVTSTTFTPPAFTAPPYLQYSPDGKKLVFVAYPTGDQYSHLYVANTDGSGLATLDKALQAYLGADGRTIVYGQFDATNSGTHALKTIEIDGTGGTLLPADGNSDHWGAQFSKDMKHISYVAVSVGPAFVPVANVYVANADGTGSKQITSYTTGLQTVNSTAWSLDGNKIAYLEDGSIRVMNSDGSSDTVIAPSAYLGYVYWTTTSGW